MILRSLSSQNYPSNYILCPTTKLEQGGEHSQVWLSIRGKKKVCSLISLISVFVTQFSVFQKNPLRKFTLFSCFFGFFSNQFFVSKKALSCPWKNSDIYLVAYQIFKWILWTRVVLKCKPLSLLLEILPNTKRFNVKRERNALHQEYDKSHTRK